MTIVFQLSLPATFLYSLAVYSLLRYCDQKSTLMVGRHLDLKTHEMNFALTNLAARFGFKGALRIMWIAIALAVASADAILNTPATFGVPSIAFTFGFIHLLAAAHNWELYNTIKDQRREEIDEAAFLFAQRLSKLGWWGRLGFLIRRNAFTFLAGLFSLFVFTSSANSLMILKLTGSSSLYFTFNNIVSLSMLGLLFFFPIVGLGTILVAARLVKSYREGRLQSGSIPDDLPFEISVEKLREAVRIADSTKTKTVRIHIGEGSSSGLPDRQE